MNNINIRVIIEADNDTFEGVFPVEEVSLNKIDSISMAINYLIKDKLFFTTVGETGVITTPKYQPNKR